MSGMAQIAPASPTHGIRNSRDETRSKTALLVIAGAAAGILAALIAIGAWFACQPTGDTGSSIMPMGDMNEAEAQAMLDEQTQNSRIGISLSPTPLLDDGRLRVNFIVNPGNNGWAERLEIEQDGVVVYASGVVAPGNRIEWADAPGAHPGTASATVYAIDENGKDHGNPVSVELEIDEN